RVMRAKQALQEKFSILASFVSRDGCHCRQGIIAPSHGRWQGASTPRLNWFTTESKGLPTRPRFPVLHVEGPTRISPLERLGHRFVEILDEGQDLVPQIRHRLEIATLDDATYQDAEPNFDLIQPRGVLRHVHEAHAMAR